MNTSKYRLLKLFFFFHLYLLVIKNETKGKGKMDHILSAMVTVRLGEDEKVENHLKINSPILMGHYLHDFFVFTATM